jgi:hypothetical protein
MLMKVTDTNTALVFDPRGIVESASTPIAARPKTLDGPRLAILDNSKWNANKILRTSTAALEKSVKFAKVNYYVKHSFSKDAEPELIAEVAANNDLVLTAIGDCGSCCSLHPGLRRSREARCPCGRHHHDRVRTRDRAHSYGTWYARPDPDHHRSSSQLNHADRS